MDCIWGSLHMPKWYNWARQLARVLPTSIHWCRYENLNRWRTTKMNIFLQPDDWWTCAFLLNNHEINENPVQPGAVLSSGCISRNKREANWSYEYINYLNVSQAYGWATDIPNANRWFILQDITAWDRSYPRWLRREAAFQQRQAVVFGVGH